MATAPPPSSLTVDLTLLARVLRGDVPASEVDRAALTAAVRLGAGQGLSVPLHRALAASPLRALLPAATVDRLARRHDMLTARARVLTVELARLAERFTAAGQRFLLLKGPYLATRFHGDALAREFADIDLMVPAADRTRAAALLQAAGYWRRSRVIASESATAFFVHAFDYGNGETGVDLHWCLSRQPTFRLPEAALWEACRSHLVGGREYTVLSDEHEVLFGILSILRDIERGSPKLKGVIDLLTIVEHLQDTLDWDAFLTARREDGTYGPSVNILALCLDATGSRPRLPRVDAALARHAARRAALAAPDVLLVPTRFGLASKRWCATVYDGTPRGWFLWWGGSLPFRAAVHRRPLGERLAKRMRPVRRAIEREGRRFGRLIAQRWHGR